MRLNQDEQAKGWEWRRSERKRAGSHLAFFFFWLHWVLIAARGLSLVAARGGYSSLQCTGFSLQWLLLQSSGSRRADFSSCGARAQ